MKQLTVGEIIRLLEQIKASTKMSDEEIKAMPVYIGNDEELNGIHMAFYAEDIGDSYDEYGDIIELIESDCCNGAFVGKAILIS